MLNDDAIKTTAHGLLHKPLPAVPDDMEAQEFHICYAHGQADDVTRILEVALKHVKPKYRHVLEQALAAVHARRKTTMSTVKGTVPVDSVYTGILPHVLLHRAGMTTPRY